LARLGCRGLSLRGNIIRGRRHAALSCIWP
jgi:hypothetical protein